MVSDEILHFCSLNRVPLYNGIVWSWAHGKVFKFVGNPIFDQSICELSRLRDDSRSPRERNRFSAIGLLIKTSLTLGGASKLTSEYITPFPNRNFFPEQLLVLYGNIFCCAKLTSGQKKIHFRPQKILMPIHSFIKIVKTTLGLHIAVGGRPIANHVSMAETPYTPPRNSPGVPDFGCGENGIMLVSHVCEASTCHSIMLCRRRPVYVC